MTALNQIRDEGNNIVLGLSNSDYVNNYHFAAAGVATVNWPDGYTIAKLGATSTFYLKEPGPAAVPVATVIDGSASRKAPSFITRGASASFGLASPAANDITVEFYQ